MNKVLTLDEFQIWILGLEPVMVVVVLNFLIGIWLLSRIMRALKEIVGLKEKLIILQLALDQTLPPLKSKPLSKEPNKEQVVEKKPLDSVLATKSITESIDLEVKAFQAALENGSSIEEASKLFNLTEDEAQVAAISYSNR